MKFKLSIKTYLKIQSYKLLESLFLSFLSPSCIVVLIEELVNKYFSTNTFNLIPIQMAKAPAYKTINVDSNNDIRERTTSPSNSSSRSYLVFSTASSTLYHKRIDINNNLLDEETTELIDSSHLSYAESNKQGKSVSRVTDNSNNIIEK